MVGTGALLVVMLASVPAGLAGDPRIGAAIAVGAKWGIVTSVHRTPARNRAVGGATNSFHLAGRAIDIARRPGVRHADIATAYRRAGFTLLESLDEGDHSHFAFGTPGEVRPNTLADAVRFALTDVKDAPVCPSEGDPAANGRRRPGWGGGCPDPSGDAARYKPLQPAS